MAFKILNIVMFTLLVIRISSTAPIALNDVKVDVCPKMRSKPQWGGKLAAYLSYQVRPVSYVIIHHTATATCGNFVECAKILRSMQARQMNELNYDDIAYNFLIGGDGVIYKGSGWGVVGAHASGFNTNAIGIAFIGDFQKKLPSPLALSAARRLIRCGIEIGELAESYLLLEALQITDKKSPALALYDHIQSWPNWSPVP